MLSLCPCVSVQLSTVFFTKIHLYAHSCTYPYAYPMSSCTHYHTIHIGIRIQTHPLGQERRAEAKSLLARSYWPVYSTWNRQPMYITPVKNRGGQKESWMMWNDAMMCLWVVVLSHVGTHEWCYDVPVSGCVVSCAYPRARVFCLAQQSILRLEPCWWPCSNLQQTGSDKLACNMDMM